MLWWILFFLSYVVSLSCSDFTCEISIFILLFPQWKQNLILLEYQFEWGSAAGSGPSAWTIQWIIWFIPGKWLISPGSRAVLLWLGLQLCVVFLRSFAVPQLEPTQACTPWLFINHRSSLATARRVWEKIIGFQIYSKLSDNLDSNFLFFTIIWVCLPVTACSGQLSHAHITLW